MMKDDTSASELRRHTLADLLRRSAARYPRRTAVVCGTVRWTYVEFEQICGRLAAGLANHGVAKGERVAILSRNSHAFAALRFALARLGAVLVPINFMLKADEAAYILRHAGITTLATDSELASVARCAAQGTAVRQLVWLPSEQATSPEPDMLDFHALAQSPSVLPEIELNASDLAQIVYTSGTESAPKGAMLTHDAIIQQYVSCIVDGEMSSEDLVLHSLPLYHCAQLDCFLGPGIYLGAMNIITGKPVPENLLPLMQQHKVTSFFAPPTVWISLLRSPLFGQCDLSALRKGYYGASGMCRSRCCARFRAACLRCVFGTSTVRPRLHRWLPCSSLRISCASLAQPDDRYSMWRRGSSTSAYDGCVSILPTTSCAQGQEPKGTAFRLMK